MTLRNFLQSLGRRWYLVLGGLLVTGVFCGVVFAQMPPAYQRTATVLLIPGSSSIPKEGNPYLYLDGLGPASDVLVSALNADSVRGGILDDYPAAVLTVERDFASSGPVLVVTTTGPTDQEVSDLLDSALRAVPVTLSGLQSQANVPTEARISSLSLTRDLTSTVIQEARNETVVVIGAAGLALTLLLAGLVDGLVLSRGKRKPLPPEAVDSSSDTFDVDRVLV